MKLNRKCPKCGGICVPCVFKGCKETKESDGHYWMDTGVGCSKCNWTLQLRSTNAFYSYDLPNVMM